MMPNGFVQAAMTEYHRSSGLQTTFISHTSGDWKSKIKASMDLVSGEDLLPGS